MPCPQDWTAARQHARERCAQFPRAAPLPHVSAAARVSAPHICLVADHAALAEVDADPTLRPDGAAGHLLVELRLDCYADLTAAGLRQTLQRLRPSRCVVTCRSRACRPQWVEAALGAQVAYLDLELSALRSKLLAVPTKEQRGITQLIVSDHYFGVAPGLELLRARRQAAEALGADVVKVALLPHSVADLVRLVDFANERWPWQRPLLPVAMGQLGFFTRVLLGRFAHAAPLCFARREATAQAPLMQPTWRELQDLYGLQSIDAQTPVYGVVGRSVMQSWSPWVHNQLLHSRSLAGVYLPLCVPEGEFANFMAELAPRLQLRGLSVTQPHKAAAAQLFGAGSEAVQRMGAANTLYRHGPTDLWQAANTDAAAALQSLQVLCGGTVRGRQILIVGAGGIARAVASAAAAAGARLLIAARRPEQAQALCTAVGGTEVPWAMLQVHATSVALAGVDVAVQCTPVGMQSDASDAVQTAFEVRALPAHCAVFDTVYSATPTALLREAALRGHRTCGGAPLFAAQAAAQAALFFGEDFSAEFIQALLPEGSR
jgi:3-dehydroquinate dehydratase/shikimate dehydrogenase